jgi:hypothetical protein
MHAAHARIYTVHAAHARFYIVHAAQPNKVTGDPESAMVQL